ncbi:MAG: hypothetical protein EOM25_13910 [Deltaproteobacteria bacterium]|nr:hypothetical protein [Deltaproteobacteria bacterium]
MEWIIVAEFDAPGPAVNKEKARLEDLALDVALRPELVVRVREESGRVFVEIHEDFYEFFQG